MLCLKPIVTVPIPSRQTPSPYLTRPSSAAGAARISRQKRGREPERQGLLAPTVPRPLAYGVSGLILSVTVAEVTGLNSVMPTRVGLTGASSRISSASNVMAVPEARTLT